MSDQESSVEKAKRASNHLRGTLAQTLDDPEADGFSKADTVALKFHGVYQQEDRDTQRAARRSGRREISFMVRVAIPGGRLSADQYLALDELGADVAGGAMRITTRQGIQYHGVLKRDLKQTVARIDRTLLTTLAACGDIPRNVMASPAPFVSGPYREMRRLAVALAQRLRPETGAYHEIWLDDERVERRAGRPDEEPFYRDTYLPRKFKLGVTVAGDNAIDAYAYDAALVAIPQGERVIGYQLLVGGGMGMTHDKPDTFARIASAIAFVEPDHAVAAIEAVVAIFRDHGNRGDRRHARIKYLLEEWGVERFRTELALRLRVPLRQPTALPPTEQHDFLGRHEQGDGRSFVGVWVPAGRIRDGASGAFRTAFREIATTLQPTVIFTPMQSVLFADLEDADVRRLDTLLQEHGVPTVDMLSPVRRYALACPALPTCGLAITEAERVQPVVVDLLEEEFARLGIDDTEVTVRITGCPNGCARPYNADIGLVGKRPGAYRVFVGGGLAGDRLADLFADDVPLPELVRTLRPLLERYRDERDPTERLSDFYRRIMPSAEQRTRLSGRETPTRGLVSLEVLS